MISTRAKIFTSNQRLKPHRSGLAATSKGRGSRDPIMGHKHTQTPTSKARSEWPSPHSSHVSAY